MFPGSSQEWATGNRWLEYRFQALPLFICGAAATSMFASQSTNFGQQKTSGKRFLPLPKCRRDTESAPVWLHVPKYERPGCRRCSASQGAGKRGKLGFPGYFFVCLTFSALDRWGKRLTFPCPVRWAGAQSKIFLPYGCSLSYFLALMNSGNQRTAAKRCTHDAPLASCLYCIPYLWKLQVYVLRAVHKKWWISKIYQAMIAYI